MPQNQPSIINHQSLATMRHSCAHLLAAAIVNLYPDVKLGIGPAIEDGFYYDFLFKKPISAKELSKIEKKMEELKKKKLKFVKKEISFAEAKKIFKSQPFKLEMIADLEEEKKAKKASLYQLGSFIDLCKGPHIPNISKIGPFKLLSVAGAYWKGDEKNPMLTRIYGTCFKTQKELEEYLRLLKEAKKRDHRRLGKKLDLYTISEEVGAGLPIWHPKLSIVRNLIEDFWKEEHRKRGYQYVYSPHMGKKALWVKSGHWQFYREMMYSPMDIEGVEYLIKPMNCPFHIQIYKSKTRSYKELPLRYCELGTVYRFEPSGTLHGLTRVRGFTQDDSHIFCRPDQLQKEILGVLGLSFEMLTSFGFEKWEVDLSVRDPQQKGKYLGGEEIWRKAEESLEKALKERKIKYQRAEGEAVFYGPKIDIKLLDALNRTWQCTTIQVDFNFPEKFDLNFIGKEGQPHRVVMVHRTILGSMERFMGCLIEQYAGAFPVWLAPVQATIIPITDKQIKYAQKVKKELEKHDLRVELDDRSETTSYKIRDAQLQKIPYMLVVGKREVKENKVAVRLRSGKDLGPVTLRKFLSRIKEEIAKKK